MQFICISKISKKHFKFFHRKIEAVNNQNQSQWNILVKRFNFGQIKSPQTIGKFMKKLKVLSHAIMVYECASMLT